MHISAKIISNMCQIEHGKNILLLGHKATFIIGVWLRFNMAEQTTLVLHVVGL